MVLIQWLSKLEQSRRSESPVKALAETKLLVEKLGILSCFKNVITVGGTNGKGSCVALLESIYLASGYRVGTFTSPHLFRFNERIRIQNQPVKDELICKAFEKIAAIQGPITLSYFQYSFLAALLIFKNANLDLVILEVGIGGRYDAVNVIEPDLSIITNIGMDHMDILGDTREKIAIEKAGIMRQGKPVICGDLRPPQNIYTLAEEKGARLYVQGKDFEYQSKDDYWNFQLKNKELRRLPLPQIELINAATVLMAINCFQKHLVTDEKNIQQGLKNVFMPGRCQLITYQDIPILFDVAHNVPAVENLKRNIQSRHVRGNVYAVFGIMSDKDVRGVLSTMLAIIDRWFVATLPEPRTVLSEQIKAILLEQQIAPHKIQCYNNPTLGFQEALKQASSKDLIVVFGSFRTVAIIMQYAGE
ncbi:MAG: bifunctional tetrahydrofolate synthase/dihydrofolate synthase [Gammaproteobacteria bacterium]|nr:bifunctional tetrahydrofolate synthase/dihydrofolate synthase [Gammaproteobacteria bacterium]